MSKQKKLRVRIEFLEEALGTLPGNENLMRDYVASKSPDTAKTMEEEIASLGLDGVEDKKMTVFPKAADGNPIYFDYQLKGFFKDSWRALAKAGKTGYAGGKAASTYSAYIKAIDKLMFIGPRQCHIDTHGMLMDTCERPLRAQTPQGERVSIAKSETIPAGSTVDFVIVFLDQSDKFEDAVRECLDYGVYSGLSQWRNSGKGRFAWCELDRNGNEGLWHGRLEDMSLEELMK